MKKNKKLLIIVWSLILLFLLVWSINIKRSDNEYVLNIDIQQNGNINNPIDYKKIINDVRNEYQNDDIVGILSIDNTDYRVPILQGEDNSYYLNHGPNGKRNSIGSVYLDYRVDIDYSRKLLIYGHNSSRTDMPFKILEEFYDINYFNNHKYMSIITSNTEKKYEIFSVYVETSDFSYMNLKLSDEEFSNQFKMFKDKSLYDTGVEVIDTDEVLVLQTCSTHRDYSNYKYKYLLIILRRVL